MTTNPETEDWLEMEVTWVERTLDEVVLVMKLACSNEVADRDDCGRTCVVDHNMRAFAMSPPAKKVLQKQRKKDLMLNDDPMDFGFGSPANKDKKKNSFKLCVIAELQEVGKVYSAQMLSTLTRASHPVLATLPCYKIDMKTEVFFLLLEGKNIIQTEEKYQKSKGCKIIHSFASIKRNHVV
ncbi:hypothetical protein IGI04_020018 [Brassica rapa subsp. trilocularis]|uniref:Uncharacterized protein n=1 Tax=Brassica rapa subsp. trilocularis TaxID=1813537 RepID=A0ABQ7MKX8_BRACM|nr:hypothetical protein IGI04_020018 [Brassica rapa subsp. trilocularis]